MLAQIEPVHFGSRGWASVDFVDFVVAVCLGVFVHIISSHQIFLIGDHPLVKYLILYRIASRDP